MQVVVVDRAGTRATGRLIRLTDTGITVKTAAGDRSFTPGEVQEMGVRRRYRLLGTLVGAGVGGALAAWADCRGGENHNCDIDLPILLGAGVGFVGGASIHSTKIAYTRAGAAATPKP